MKIHVTGWILILVTCLLMSCTVHETTIETGSPAVETTGLRETAVTEPLHITTSDETETESQTQAEDTLTVPSVPYTLEHHVTDLTPDMPPLILALNGKYTNRDISYTNTFVQNGKLYLFNLRYTDDEKTAYYRTAFENRTASDEIFAPILKDEMEGYLTVFENGVKTEELPVPRVNGELPQNVYLLRDGSYMIKYSEGTWPDEVWYLAVVEADGTLIADLCLSETYPDIWGDGDYVIREMEDGKAILLHRYMSGMFIRVQYDPATRELITEERFYYQKLQDSFKHLSTMEYAGEGIWLPLWKVSECTVFNSNTGIYEKRKFRIPEDKDHMVMTVDRQGQYYLYDKLGLYAYRDNLPAVKLADWIQCGVTADINYQNLWIIDEHNFYITKAAVYGNFSTSTLYYIHTEMVPDENPKQEIVLDYYGYSEWIENAVIAFNRTSDDYEIRFNNIDPVNLNAAEIRAAIDNRTITHGLPDIVITDMAINFRDYEDKGVLLDLKPYFGDRLLGCVTDVMDFGGHLYTLPTELQINTFLCLPEVTGDFLTWDVFMDAAETLAEGEVLFSDERAIKYLRENGIMDFFDFADGRAEYDTDRFREVVMFLEDLETRVDTTAGYVTTHSDGTNGYTNPTLPARMRDGGLTFLNLWVRNAEALVTARLLYGEEDFVWCGYPSEHGGGANVNALGRIAVNADTGAKEGCLAFVESLLTPEYQTADTHDDLPITREGMLRLIEQNRYWYYGEEAFKLIGNPAAPMREPSIALGASVPPIVPTSAGFSSDNPDEPVVDGTVIVKLEDSDINAFMHFLDNCHMSAGSDETVEAIVTEELSYWENGVKPLEEVTKIIQSRVGIYLAERK